MMKQSLYFLATAGHREKKKKNLFFLGVLGVLRWLISLANSLHNLF
jgi:hypothetical protein